MYIVHKFKRNYKNKYSTYKLDMKLLKYNWLHKQARVVWYIMQHFL